MFTNTITSNRVIDLSRVFGIHLVLSSILCFCFGQSHLGGVFGPGMWSSDEEAIAGLIRTISPNYSLLGLSLYSTGTIVAHHAAAGIFGIGVGTWHISSKPGPSVFRLVRLGSIEAVLSSSIITVLWTASIVASSCWFGTVTQPIELNGPTRYHWDNAFFNQVIDLVFPQCKMLVSLFLYPMMSYLKSW